MSNSEAIPEVKSVTKKTLTTTGVTINAMALIAPGAFLWITFQLQAAGVDLNGKSTAFDMWQGVVFALVIAFLTAISYAEMAKLYPDAGFGSAYYFAEKTFLDKEESSGHHKWARISKLFTGWAAHLFYWVYPGVMVAFFAVLVSYIAGLFGAMDGTGNAGLSLSMRLVVAVIFAVATGFIAVRGISGSTLTNLIVNIIQLATLVIFSGLAIAYRLKNPDHAEFFALKSGQIGHAGAASILIPHSLVGITLQSTIAILILVGFESCTALGAEAIDAKKSVPRGVLLSLVIQGLFAYLIEYFAANFALSNKLTYVDATSKTTYYGMDAAAKSSAPIGDMVRVFGDSLLHGVGFGLCVTMSVTVALAILGTVLACTNTAVRVSHAMAQDNEMPEILGLMHGKFATPHAATWVLTAVSAIIGCIGCYSVVALTGITLASNLGTFVLYALICVWTLIAFAGRKERNVLLHGVIPFLGLVTNLFMVAAIFYVAIKSGGDAAHEGYIAFGIAGFWALISLVYLAINGARTGRKLIGSQKITA